MARHTHRDRGALRTLVFLVLAFVALGTALVNAWAGTVGNTIAALIALVAAGFLATAALRPPRGGRR